MRTRQIISMILTAAMVLSLLPAFTVAASVTEVGIDADTSNIAVGDRVYFGKYPQSGYVPTQEPTSPVEGTIYTDMGGTEFAYVASPKINQGNYYKIEPIEWRVLENANGELFLLSEKLLETRTYHNSSVSITWESSEIRKWLNDSTNSFMSRAFSENEQTAILTTDVSNPNNPSYSTSGGNETKDEIFFLSIQEVTTTTYGFNYFSDDSSRAAKNTDYAKSTGSFGDNNNGYWWLRSPGDFDDYAAFVNNNGVVDDIGLTVNTVFFNYIAVRPAFKLNLASVIFASDVSGTNVKSSATVGGNLISAKPVTENLKLTVVDEYNASTNSTGLSLSTTVTSVTAKNGGDVSIQYTDAKTGARRSVSVLITKIDGTPLFYGRLVDCSTNNASGTANFTVPNNTDLPEGNYKLLIFNEECNGDYYTDFASTPIDIAMTVDNPPTVSGVSPNGGSVAITANTLSVTFNEEMNTAPGTVSLSPTGATLSFTGWTDGNKTANYSLSGLAYNTTYTIEISDFEDLAGNVMVTDNNRTFTTEAMPTLGKVVGVTLSTAGVATWTNLTSETGLANYSVQLYKDGAALGTATTSNPNTGTSGVNFLSEMRTAGVGSYTVTVTAIGDGTTHSSGEESEPSFSTNGDKAIRANKSCLVWYKRHV